MSELEEKLNTLLGNPQLMQQIAAMAQSMEHKPDSQPQQPAAPMPDPMLLQTMAQTFGQAGMDGNQKALLEALSPYLSNQRIRKLERAMQAARLAGAASAFLGAGGLQALTGR